MCKQPSRLAAQERCKNIKAVVSVKLLYWWLIIRTLFISFGAHQAAQILWAKIQAVVIQLFTHVIKSPRNKTGTKIQRCVFLFLTSFPFVTSFSFCFPKFVLAMSHDVTGRIFIMSLSWWIACLRLSTANNEFEFCREREKELRYSYTTQTSPYSFFLIDIYSFL